MLLKKILSTKSYLHWQILLNLVKKNLKIRYKNSILGFLWSLLNPLATMLVMFIVFSAVLKIDKFGKVDNFVLFLLCGVLPWNFLSTSLSEGTASIARNPSLVKQVYFPRELIPLSVVFTNLINHILTLFAFLFLIFLFSLIGFIPFTLSLTLFFLPLIIALECSLIIGLVFFFSSLNVFYRDIEHFLEFFLVLWFYLTPIFYPLSLIPPVLQALYYLNPMTLITEMFRRVIMHSQLPGFSYIFGVLIEIIIVFIIGYYVFNYKKGLFAENV